MHNVNMTDEMFGCLLLGPLAYECSTGKLESKVQQDRTGDGECPVETERQDQNEVLQAYYCMDKQTAGGLC